MLDPWIIEEIRKREDLDRREERPVLEILMDHPQEPDPAATEEVSPDKDEVDRGVVIVEFGISRA